MQLIDQSFFIGEINIPNPDTEGVSENLDVFINKYQKRFLTLLLGEEVYAAFMAGLDQDPVDAKWTELKDKLVDQDTKESPIANYVYWFYMDNGATTTTGVGETIALAENSYVVSPAHKMVKAWNEAVNFLHTNSPWFNEWYVLNGYNYDWYFFNLSCYDRYVDEFPYAYKNTLGI